MNLQCIKNSYIVIYKENDLFESSLNTFNKVSCNITSDDCLLSFLYNRKKSSPSDSLLNDENSFVDFFFCFA